MLPTRISYKQIEHDKMESILSVWGFVEVEMSSFHARPFIGLVQHHQRLEDYSISDPGQFRRDWDFLVGVLRLLNYSIHPRLSGLMSFWVLSKTTIGWQREKNGKYIFGFLGGKIPADTQG